MIDTEDLTSYIPGYDDYCEPSIEKDDGYDDYYYDNYVDQKLEEKYRKEQDIMERKIIDLNKTNMTLEETLNLKDYIWKKDKLIPTEMLEGE